MAVAVEVARDDRTRPRADGEFPQWLKRAVALAQQHIHTVAAAD